MSRTNLFGTDRVEKWEWAALGAILVLGLTVRLIGLDAQLWYDEIFTLTHYVRAPWGQLVSDFSSLNNHMFYSLQAKVAVVFFGKSVWALRVPALLFGLGSIVLLWVMARAVASRTPALLATFLMAISYHHVWFSQNARGYTGLLFWTMLATLLLVEGLKRPRWRTWTGYGICVAAAMYTHLSAGFFFAAHALVYAIAWLARRASALAPYPGLNDTRPVWGFVLGSGLTFALHISLLGQVLSAMNKVSEGKTTSTMAEWANPLRTLQEIAGSLQGLGPLAPLALVGVLVVFVAGVLALWRRAPLLVAIYVLSIPLALTLLLLLDFRIWPRYFFVDIAFVLLSLTVGMETLCQWFARLVRWPKGEGTMFAAGAVVATAASAVLLMPNYARPKQDFGGAIAMIDAQRLPGDAATSLGLASEPISSFLAPDWPVTRDEEDLKALERRSKRVWLITAFDDHVRTGQVPAIARVRHSYVLVREFEGTLGGGTVKLYRSQ